MENLRKIISVDPDKCVNCHACIAKCPVKSADNDSGNHVTFNSDLCIGYSSLPWSCNHGTRTCLDDFDVFMEDTQNRLLMATLAAPWAEADFPNQYLNLNGRQYTYS